MLESAKLQLVRIIINYTIYGVTRNVLLPVNILPVQYLNQHITASRITATASVSAMYSASHVNNATVGCFRLLYETKGPQPSP